MELVQQGAEDRSAMRGIIRVRALPPDMSVQDVVEMWKMLTEKERDRYTVFATRNAITAAGKQNVLNYIGSTVLATGTSGFGAVVPFAAYFAVGTSAVAAVYPGDTSVQGELFRAQPSLATVSGYSVDISTQFGTTQANGTYTNCGFFGGSATGTSGSGTLMTHALFPYTKNSSQVLVCDYTISLA